MPRILHHLKSRPPATSSVRFSDAQGQLREHLPGAVALQLSATLGGRDITGSCVLFEVMNTLYAGPGVFLAPEVAHGAGVLHVVGVMEDDRLTLDAHPAGWQHGKSCLADACVHTGQRLEIELTGYPLHLDEMAMNSARRFHPDIDCRHRDHARACDAAVPGTPPAVDERASCGATNTAWRPIITRTLHESS